MNNMDERLKVSVFSDNLCRWGLKTPQKYVSPFPFSFLNRLRPFLYAGIPANVTIALNEMCRGKCYERAELAMLGLDDCELVKAKVNSLWRPKEQFERAGHAFLEKGNKIYDTTAGLVFDRDFYYEVEEPQVEAKFSKKEVMEGSYTMQRIMAEDTNDDKYALTVIKPMVDHLLATSREPSTAYYKPYIEREWAQYLRGIKFEDILRESDEDFKLSMTDPDALDRKLGIIRDKQGQEISRNGVPNPYYRAPDEKHWHSVNDFNNLHGINIRLNNNERAEIEHQMDLENEQMREKGRARMARVALNPTAFAYEIDMQN